MSAMTMKKWTSRFGTPSRARCALRRLGPARTPGYGVVVMRCDGPRLAADLERRVLELGRPTRAVVLDLARGVSSAFPGIAGQHAKCLASQLRAWRGGTRKGDPGGLMETVASKMTDAEITAVSAWLAGQPGRRGKWGSDCVCFRWGLPSPAAPRHRPRHRATRRPRRARRRRRRSNPPR